jgi:hypothetical protein
MFSLCIWFRSKIQVILLCTFFTVHSLTVVCCCAWPPSTLGSYPPFGVPTLYRQYVRWILPTTGGDNVQTAASTQFELDANHAASAEDVRKYIHKHASATVYAYGEGDVKN